MRSDSPSVKSAKSRVRLKCFCAHWVGIQIVLSRPERRRLERGSRKTQDAHMKRRCQTILLRAKGWTYRAIANALGCSASTVSAVVKRWNEVGEAGFGRPPGGQRQPEGG